MITNESKTKFMVIRSGVHGKIWIKISSSATEHCKQNVCLQFIFTADGSTKSSLCAQVPDRQKHYTNSSYFFVIIVICFS